MNDPIDSAQGIIGRAVPTFSRGTMRVFQWCRWRPLRTFALAVGLACGLLYVASNSSAEKRAIRRLRELDGVATGREESPFFPAKWASVPIAGRLVDLTLQRNVTSLKLDGKPFTDRDFELFAAAFPECGTLHASATSVTDAAFDKLDGSWGDLNRISLRRTAVGDRTLTWIATRPQLWELSLDETQVTDAGLVQLPKLQQLYKLSLDGTQITDAGIKHIVRMPSLHSLSLARTNVTDAELAEFAIATKLHTLSLAGTQITDAGLVHLARVSNLSTLDVSQTKVTDAGVEALQQIKGFSRLTH